MFHHVLVIDDQPRIAQGLANNIHKSLNITTNWASAEADIQYKISHLYYNIAIVDLQMDDYAFDGIDVIEKILDENPFSKIIIITGYLKNYFEAVNAIKSAHKNRIRGVIEKTADVEFLNSINGIVKDIIEEYNQNPNAQQLANEGYYADAKNEIDSYQKGMKFEYFVSILFGQMGFKHIQKRVIDKSRNEVDLVIRNDIEDSFFQKFKPYIFVECKNHTDNIGKNDFITFYSKLENSNDLANIGFFITTSGMAKTAYLEAMRTSNKSQKMFFITHREIALLIQSNDMLATLKQIIDEQVKDN
jgi:ActR/RegA family two-component response regulator